MRKIIVSLACLFFISCNLKNGVGIKDDENLLMYVKDSTDIFYNIGEIRVSGEIESATARIKYYSISEDEFLNAFEKNRKNIRVFSLKHRENEFLDSVTIVRKDSTLNIGNLNKTYVDFGGSNNKRDSRYFLNSKVGDYFVLKRIQFEDDETLFLNANTGNVDLILPTINVFTKTKDSLVFVSDARSLLVGDEASSCLMEIHHNRVDTIVYENTNWFTSFAFFDENESFIYYIHNYYSDNDIVATFARMEIERKNE